MKNNFFRYLAISVLISLTGINIALAQSENTLPRVCILATGGTIAGSAEGNTAANYTAGVIGVNQIISSVQGLDGKVALQGIQVANVGSQDIRLDTWISLANAIDSIFAGNHADGIVITHGTDTMEETAFFLNLIIKHNRPVVITGAMRPSTALSADGPMNLFNAVCLAADPRAAGKGVMVLMNDHIFSADDLLKNNTRNVDAFTAPNKGPLGEMSGGKARFYRSNDYLHTEYSEFGMDCLAKLPQVEIVYAYAFASDIAFKALIKEKVDGIIIAGVGHGNYNSAYEQCMKEAAKKGITVIRSSRITPGGVNEGAEGYDPQFPVCYTHSPQQARILLMLALTKTHDLGEIQKIFEKY